MERLASDGKIGIYFNSYTFLPLYIPYEFGNWSSRAKVLALQLDCSIDLLRGTACLLQKFYFPLWLAPLAVVLQLDVSMLIVGCQLVLAGHYSTFRSAQWCFHCFCISCMVYKSHHDVPEAVTSPDYGVVSYFVPTQCFPDCYEARKGNFCTTPWLDTSYVGSIAQLVHQRCQCGPIKHTPDYEEQGWNVLLGLWRGD